MSKLNSYLKMTGRQLPKEGGPKGQGGRSTPLVSPSAPNPCAHWESTLLSDLDLCMHSVFLLDNKYSLYKEWRAHMTNISHHHMIQINGKPHMTVGPSSPPKMGADMEVGGRGGSTPQCTHQSPPQSMQGSTPCLHLHHPFKVGYIHWRRFGALGFMGPHQTTINRGYSTSWKSGWKHHDLWPCFTRFISLYWDLYEWSI